MKLKRGAFFHYLDFNMDYCLLSPRNTKIIYDYFCLLDVHKKKTLNDVQFYCFMKHVTDLERKNIKQTFDLLDSDEDGEICFEEFYFLICILLSNEHRVVENFLYRHYHLVFQLLDTDCSNSINLKEFHSLGFLFNLKMYHFKQSFRDSDTSKDELLNSEEFWMFTFNLVNRKQSKKEMDEGAIEESAEHDAH